MHKIGDEIIRGGKTFVYQGYGVWNEQKRSIKFVDQDGTEFGVKQDDNKIVISTDGEVTEGATSKISVADSNADQLQADALKELKKINLQLAFVTDNLIDNRDI